mgnify:CR=1 FL=1
MDHVQIIKDIKNKVYHPVYFLTGEEPYYIDLISDYIEDNVLDGTHCPLCNSSLAVKQGRYGMFIGCTNFPTCEHIEDTNQKDDVGVSCPSCKTGELFEKTNRYGKTFYSCDQYPSCKYVINYPPVNEICPECAWPMLVERKMASGNVHICPQKKCTYKRKLS